MSEETVLVEARDGYRVITLNRPQRLNAFTGEMHRALAAALAAAEADKGCRAVLLTGAGRAFSAGQDLSERMRGEGDAAPDLGETLETFYNPLIRRIRSAPFPIVVAVNGAAAGASANIAYACDIVLAAKSATFLQAFARLGLVPDAGGTYLLPRLAGDARARGMALLAEPISAETALQWGLIWRVVDDASLMDEAHALCARLAEAPTDGLARIKRALNASSANTLDGQLDLERDLQRACGQHGDYREGVAAFLEKRKAKFKGRA